MADVENDINEPPALDKDSPHTKSLKIGGKHKESSGKEKSGRWKSLSLSSTSNYKRTENTNNDGNQTSDSPIRPSDSPDLNSPPSHGQKNSFTRSKSDSAGSITGNLAKRGASLRKSLGLGTKKLKQEQLEPLTEASTLPEEPAIVDSVREEIRDIYSLPEIPTVPLSVMEINKLIEKDVLEEAYVNLLSLRLEFQHEHQDLDKEDCPIELVHKEKDLHLLYGTLKTKISNIICSSSAMPSHYKETLVYVAHIILEEKKREGEPGGMLGWKEVFRDAVRDGVRDTLKNVPLESQEQNISWLAVHLGLVGKATVENLERVKLELVSSYPPDFNVFETYVSCHHEVVGDHLKALLEKVTELKDYYAFLDFIIHNYSSKKIMGHSSLQPEMKEDWKALPLDKTFLDQTKSKYCSRLQTDMRKSLDRVIDLENEEMWENRRKPTIDEGLYSSHMDMDIWTNITGHVQGSRRIDVNLEQKVVRSCLDEVKLFPKRFELAFVKWSSTVSNTCLWAEYHISYINSFSALKEHMDCFKETAVIPLQQVQTEIDGLISRLKQTLMQRFKTDVEPFLRRQMTRKWFSFDDDFSQLINKIKSLSEQTKYMSLKHKQNFIDEAHFFVVKEYVSQLMKNNYSCKNQKNETAASKITSQWTELKNLFQNMNSTFVWLHSVGDQLSKIIGCKKRDIKNNLQPLVETYPDIKKSHLSAVLYFRGVIRGREKHNILQRLMELKQRIGNDGNKDHVLFSEIQAAVNTECFAGTPFMCFSLIVSDS